MGCFCLSAPLRGFDSPRSVSAFTLFSKVAKSVRLRFILQKKFFLRQMSTTKFKLGIFFFFFRCQQRWR